MLEVVRRSVRDVFRSLLVDSSLPRFTVTASRWRRRLMGACAVAMILLVATPSDADEARYQGEQGALDRDARAALAAGDFARALPLFSRLVALDPRDAAALREAGRCAQALGDLAYAERALARAHAL